MNDHNLDDLIIDNENPPLMDKTKAILTILALLIIILVIAIVFTKIVLKEPTVDTVVKNDVSKFRSPNLKTLHKPKTDIHQQNKYQRVEKPSHTVKTTQKEDILDDLGVNDKKSVIQKPIVKPVKPIESHQNTKPVVKPKQEVHTVVKQKPVEKPNSKPEVKQKPVSKSKQTQSVKVKPKSEKSSKPSKHIAIKVPITDEFEQIDTTPQKVTTNTSKVDKSVKSKATHISTNTTEKYYIQVGSFSKEPSGKFLGIIKRSGFTYTIMPTSHGVKKLLIGPYSSKEAVNSALPKVRDRINKSAFVYKVK